MALSPRELEIFILLKEKYSLQQIAIKLNIAKGTVQSYKKRIDRKCRK